MPVKPRALRVASRGLDLQGSSALTAFVPLHRGRFDCCGAFARARDFAPGSEQPFLYGALRAFSEKGPSTYGAAR